MQNDQMRSQGHLNKMYRFLSLYVSWKWVGHSGKK